MKHLAPFYMKPVRFDHILRRRRDPGTRTWVRTPTKRLEGVVIGIRQLQNGETEWADYSNNFTPKSYTLALVVVFSPYRNPVYVLPLDAHEIMPNGS